MRTDDEWRRVRRESDDAASAELIGADSSVMVELETKKEAAKQAQAEAEMTHLYLTEVDAPPNTITRGDLFKLYCQKSLADFKLGVLEKHESKLAAELEALREQNRALSKKLGKPVHNI